MSEELDNDGDGYVECALIPDWVGADYWRWRLR